ncbi:MAG: hypothetical protein RR595_08095 [Lysinibacillus sp.]
MHLFGIVVAIFVSAFLAVGIAEHYEQPYNGYLLLLMMLAAFFIQIIILIVKEDLIDGEEERY